MRIARLLFACLLLSLLVGASTTAHAATRMWFGFQDDPTLRWRDDRVAMFDRAQQYNISVVRTTVYWARTAPTRPANAANPSDPAYRFDDLDEFVRNAAQRGIAVMLTIWGTPGWANGGKGQNVPPTQMSDLTNFAKAVASRYNGRRDGIPAVQFYGVWNESNLQQFLAPQYDKKGKPVSPFTYAKLYRAAYAGIKSGSPFARVGIGETSPRGRGPVLGRRGMQGTVAPGTFARLLSTVRPKLKFDAWSHHPYSTLGAGPFQRVRFPNVNLAELPIFEQNLAKWFGRKVPIWITEYGFETKPGEPKGVTLPQQAAYLRQSVLFAQRDPNVEMYIWFIFRDDPTSTWQSGVLSRDSSEKRAANVYPALAKLVDARSPVLDVRAGSAQPVVRLPVFELAARAPRDAVGSTARAYIGKRLVGVSQPTAVVGYDGWVAFPAPIAQVAKNTTYSVVYDMSDANGNRIFRTATIVGT